MFGVNPRIAQSSVCFEADGRCGLEGKAGADLDIRLSAQVIRSRRKQTCRTRKAILKDKGF
jgi:hypothetical protein